jgi:hypothetical protein
MVGFAPAKCQPLDSQFVLTRSDFEKLPRQEKHLAAANQNRTEPIASISDARSHFSLIAA